MLSVVIPTRNRAEFLATALESIADQNLSPDQFEVLVIDNGSTDRTKDVVDEMQSRLANLRCIYAAEPGLHVGRHRGLKEAAGDVLVYADDDIRAMPRWLSTLADIFSDPAVAMAGGNNIPDFQGPVPSWLDTLWSEPQNDGQMIGSLSVLSLPDGSMGPSPFCMVFFPQAERCWQFSSSHNLGGATGSSCLLFP